MWADGRSLRHPVHANLEPGKRPAMAASLEFNKALAAVLTAGIIASGAGVLSRMIYHPVIPEERAYPIDMSAVEQAGQEAAQEQEQAVDISQLLATGNPGAGATGAEKGAAFYIFEKGGANKI